MLHHKRAHRKAVAQGMVDKLTSRILYGDKKTNFIGEIIRPDQYLKATGTRVKYSSNTGNIHQNPDYLQKKKQYSFHINDKERDKKQSAPDQLGTAVFRRASQKQMSVVMSNVYNDSVSQSRQEVSKTQNSIDASQTVLDYNFNNYMQAKRPKSSNFTGGFVNKD